jgi:phosphoribosyl 1,2-cyclic phosphate phosphodiesterase
MEHTTDATSPLTITFLGTGTSQGVPVIGCQCAICISTDARNKRLRSSVLLTKGDQKVIIDTGPDFRYQMLREKVNRLDAILLTHAHKDHIAGLDDVRAFNRMQAKPMDIYGDNRVHEAIKREFYYAFQPSPYPGIPQLQLHLLDGTPFELGHLSIQPIEVMHHLLPVYGFRIGDFAYITDAKTISTSEKAKLKGLSILVINALQIKPHISHFTLEEAIEMAKELGAKNTYFTHISHFLGLHEEVQAILPPTIHLAFDGLTLSC